jgi:hypothetical protein
MTLTERPCAPPDPEPVPPIGRTAAPCPACQARVDAAAAASSAAEPGHPPADRCPDCEAVLLPLVRLTAPGDDWHWELDDAWLADRRRRAAAYDRLIRGQHE